MARWRARGIPPRIEGPAWYRTFDPAAWDEPDEQERRMLAGCDVLGPEWVAGRHRIHAERRWGEAKHRYRKDHPMLAEQEMEDLLGGELEARAQEKRQPGASSWLPLGGMGHWRCVGRGTACPPCPVARRGPEGTREMDEIQLAEQYRPAPATSVAEVLARAAAMPDLEEIQAARAEREQAEAREEQRERMAMANRQMGDPLGHATRAQMAVAEARDRVRDLEGQLGQARGVLHRAAEEYVDWSGQAEQVTATVTRSGPYDLLAGSKAALAEARVDRMLMATRSQAPGRRPFASRGAVARRSESCQWCIDQNVSDEQSYLLHSDPELAVPITTPQQAAQWREERAGSRSEVGTPMIYR